MSHKIGITGFIGTGKTTLASILSDLGVPVWDADKSVHNLYKKNCAGYNTLVQILPSLQNQNGIDRNQLNSMIRDGHITLGELEDLIHPLLVKERINFIETNQHFNILCFDIPLLFETKANLWLDTIILTTCSTESQLKRLKGRGNAGLKKFDYIMRKQAKTKKYHYLADYVIDTDKEKAITKKEIVEILDFIKDEINA